jgi:putative ATP-dependent endonuclease of OLD family
MYLANLYIKNFRAIEYLQISFEPKLNIIIGENGCGKTAVIDAMRLLYSLGDNRKEIYISDDDFYLNKENNFKSSTIELKYIFRGLTQAEKGALYEYLVIDKDNPENTHAQITIKYERRERQNPKFIYYTGNSEEQKADYATFEIFQHYYLGALRHSTNDLNSIKSNMLGSVIRRLVERSNNEENFRQIINTANANLLAQKEVIDTRASINTHLDDIFKIANDNQIGLRIEETSKIESIVNVIKPYLPHNRETLNSDGFHLDQNSLGYNNLIYIAIILGDIRERIADNSNQHFALLIEEPEAHLHPQLQLNLYNFLKSAGTASNCQLFITTHSPTLTSKANLDNLILLRNNAVNIGACFHDRLSEGIIEQIKEKKTMTDTDFHFRKNQLERYLDVTKSQLFFAKGILLVEGISEKLLLKSFAERLGNNLEDHRCEIVCVDGVSFYAFIHLFNSDDQSKRLAHKVSIVTDDDRYAKEKNSFKNLTKENFRNLDSFHLSLYNAGINNRTGNLRSSIRHQNTDVKLFIGFKTLEYEIALANTSTTKSGFENNILIQFLSERDPKRFDIIRCFLNKLPNNALSVKERQLISILVWKLLPPKAEFAQDFSYYLESYSNNTVEFHIPEYLTQAISYTTNEL